MYSKKAMKIVDEIIDSVEFLAQSNYIEGVKDSKSLDQAVLAWEYVSKVKKLTPSVILKTHKILMLNQPMYGFQRGYFRREGVTIAGRDGMNWKLIPEAIAQWCEIVNNKRNDLEIREDHVKYEIIHPFIDGNGRTGRIFLNWQRLRNKLNILIIREEERFEYYKWFASVG